MWEIVKLVLFGIGKAIISGWFSRDPEKERLQNAVDQKAAEADRLAMPDRDPGDVSRSLRAKYEKHLSDTDLS